MLGLFPPSKDIISATAAALLFICILYLLLMRNKWMDGWMDRVGYSHVCGLQWNIAAPKSREMRDVPLSPQFFSVITPIFAVIIPIFAAPS